MLPSSENPQNGIFVRSKLDFKKDFKIHKLVSLSHIAVKNGEMIAAINECTLLRQSVLSSDKENEITLPLASTDSISQVHLSPNGFHAIVSTKQSQNYYIHMKSNAVHNLKRLKCNLTAVGWNPENSKDSETGPILLGTQQGAVVETSISAGGVLNNIKEHTSCLSTEKLSSNPAPAVIYDIQLFSPMEEDMHSNRWLVVIAQPTRVLCVTAPMESTPMRSGVFTSSASLQAGLLSLPEQPQTFFHPFFTSKDAQKTSLHSRSADRNLVKTAGASSKRSLVFYPLNSKPSRFAWLTVDGVITGRADVFAEKIEGVLVEEQNIEHRLIEGRLEPAVGIALTEYHVVLAYSTRLIAVSLLTNAVVFEDTWPTEYGVSVGLTVDPCSAFIWLHTATVCMKFRPNDEARYVWRIFLEQKDFTRASQIARVRSSIDPEAYDMVQRKHAEFYIEEKNFTAAAEILAVSNEPFESAVLKFLSNDEDRRMGLKTLLDKKLERIRPEDRMKRDSLVIWLLDIQLTELAELRRKKDKDGEVRDVVDHVQRFLMRKNVFDAVSTNRTAVYKMTVAHADFEMQLFIANAVKDTQTVINIYMMREQYASVLEVLKQQNAPELVYELAPLLIEHIPKQLIGYLVQNEQIQPIRMLPMLSICSKTLEMAIYAVKYIDWAVIHARCNDFRFHNLLIHLLAKHRPKGLLDYLTRCGTQRSSIPYDLEFAMRTCEEYQQEQCVVYLYCVAEMFPDAVERALKIDVELATKCARMMDVEEEENLFDIPSEPRFSNEYRKKIWLKIATHMISNGMEAGSCIALLKESKDALTIQDILPLFPEFTKIDHFKEPLCTCLREHSVKIQELQHAMKDATQTAAEIREKTERIKNKVMVMKSGETCAQCSRTLAGRPFFAHSCRHFFHRECLETAMIPFLPQASQKRLDELIGKEKKLLIQLEMSQKMGRKAEVADLDAQFESTSTEIGQILGSDCPFCGSIAITLVDKPFFTKDEYARDESSWLI